MAVLDSLLGVEVTIWSEGSQLEEYDDLDDEVRQTWKHKTISKYIASETDSQFFFKLRVGKPYVHDCDELGFAIILDGCQENVDSHLCCPDDLKDDGEWEFDVHGVEVHDSEGARLKKFSFAKVDTTDGDVRHISKAEVEDLRKIGQIEVRVHQLQHCRKEKPKPKLLRGALGVVPEKVFGGQAISHSISYETEELLSSPSFYRGTRYMHGWDGPIGVFRFKYRSRRDLQKELIIPRTPSPQPQSLPSAAELTLEQKLRLARMRFDDVEMLESLTGTTSNPAGRASRSSERRFENLSLAEINQLALQKHAEMAGIPIFKPEPGITIKQEPRPADTLPPRFPNNRHQPSPVASIARGKRAIDLTIHDDNDDDDEVEILAVRKVKKPWTGKDSLLPAPKKER